MMYFVGHNMPGYMPESDVYDYETFDEAKRSLIDELIFSADNADTEEDAELFTFAAEDVNFWSTPGSVMIGGNVYWIETD